MAVSWCWAFGQESSAVLEGQMEWEFDNISAANGQPSNTFTYTYVGSPPRFSWAQGSGFNATHFTLPAKAFVPAGWVTFAIYNDGTTGGAYLTNNRVVQVTGAITTRAIWIQVQNGGTSTFSLFVDNVFKASFTMVINNWHYVALQYNMGVNPWEGRVFVDGTAATALFTDPQNVETLGAVTFQAITSGTRTNYFAQAAIYNSTADTAELPRFVTRISPDTDSSDTGTWVPPSGAGAQVAVTANDPFNNATFTEDAAPASGDQVTTTFAAPLSTQLGVAAGLIDGITGHSYSSGTAIQCFAATGAAGAFTSGANYTPDLVDTTYGFATAPINPATAVAWAPGDTVQLKYEIV